MSWVLQRPITHSIQNTKLRVYFPAASWLLLRMGSFSSAVVGTAAQNQPAANPRRKIKELEVMVVDVIHETPDTRTLMLFSGNDPLDYRPGHFLTIAPQQFQALERWTSYLEHLKNRKEPARAYSLSSAPHERYLAITVKEERYVAGITPYPPLLSPILALRTSPGARIVITGFTGPYTLPDDAESRTDQILHICAGSGIVPSYSIIKDSLFERKKLRHTLLYSNKSWKETIFARQLIEMQQKYPNQLRVIFTITRDIADCPKDVHIVQGRITRELIRQYLDPAANPQVFVCGPSVSCYEKHRCRQEGTTPAPRFMESVLIALNELEFPPSLIRSESYG